MIPTNEILQGNVLDVLKTLPDGCVQTCVTSPPYWGLRDYGVEGQLGLEKTPEEFIAKLVDIFREVRRVLRDDGTCWVNLGDSYAGGAGGRGDIGNTICGQSTRITAVGEGRIKKALPSDLKPKDLVGIPWRVALALQADGWYLRQDIIWAKPNPMPESVTDRCTKSHEYIFLMSKSAKYYYDHEAIKEPATETNDARQRMGQGPNTQYAQKRAGVNSRIYQDRDPHHPTERKIRKEFNPSQAGGGTNVINHSGNSMTVNGKRNKRDVWTVATYPVKEAHFATFPPKLIEPCVLAGCPAGGLVLDPFMGAGTTALVSVLNNRRFLGIELNPAYIALTWKRLEKELEKHLKLSERKPRV